MVSGEDRLLTPGEVSTLFRVHPATVRRWVAANKIHPILTPGGRRRYRESEIREHLKGEVDGQDQDTRP